MTKIFKRGFFITISGIEFDLLNPEPSMISLNDITHSLAMINRFNGHIVRPYSVAEHLCRCYMQAEHEGQDRRTQMEVLIHDFAEAYYHDLMTPIKELLGEAYSIAEKKCQTIIHKIFTGRDRIWHPNVVKTIDARMLATEARDITIQKRWWDDNQPYSHFEIPKYQTHWTVWRDRLKEHVRRLT